jgi:SAM-dependent methyltransferase
VTEPLDTALAALRPLLLDGERLVRAVAAGRRRGAEPPPWRRVELRPVDLKAGRRLQRVLYDDRQAYTRNVTYDGEAASLVDELLALPFGNWHVETVDETIQLRVTKKGAAQVHRAARSAPWDAGAHDRAKPHLLDPGDPLFSILGADADKRRQVDAFLRLLDPVIGGGPLRIVDLGCGNAYLTFAAYRHLTHTRGIAVQLTGVDLRPTARERNTALAKELGWDADIDFIAGSILDAPLDAPDIVLALHACDTATDEALARSIRWQAPVVLAAPCCHHDLQAQLRRVAPPAPYRLITRYGILRERFADVLTDAFRAALLRQHGYRVEVMEFIDTKHTPRNVLIRAVRTGASGGPDDAREYAALTGAWQVRPKLAELLDEPPYHSP